MEYGDGSQMGGTSREGFVAPPTPPCRGHFSDSGKNAPPLRAGDGDNDRVLTEEIIYDARPTEG